MSWFNTFKERIAHLMGRVPRDNLVDDFDGEIANPNLERSTLGPLGSILMTVLLIPFQILFLPLRALGLFHSSGVDVEFDEDYQEMSFWSRAGATAKRTAWGLLMLPYYAVTAPVRFFQGLGRTNAWEVVFITPALVMLLFFGYVFTQVFIRADVIKNRYAKGVRAALANQEYRLAKTYFERLVLEGELSAPQQLQRMLVLQQTGELEQAQEILDTLAPEDNLGHAPAHKIKALKLATMIASGRAKPDTLIRLGRHLGRTNDDAPETLQAWTLYYKQMGQHDEAISKLKAATKKNPGLYMALANYLASLASQEADEIKREGYREQYKAVLTEAEITFSDILANNNANQSARINLANVLSRQDRIGDAETRLVEGFRIQQDPQIRTALASFFSMRYDRAKANQESTKRQLDYLIKALYYEPNHGPIYQRLMQMYLGDEKTEDDLATIRLELQQIIAGDSPSEIAHFSLSNILWTEGKQEQAIFHLEQAYKLNPSFVVVLNNHAWILAHLEKPELERALELANRAIEVNPKDPRFRDTRGTILLKMKRYRDAITDLNLAKANQSGNTKEIHKKLYAAYSALEMHDLAKIHLENSK